MNTLDAIIEERMERLKSGFPQNPVPQGIKKHLLAFIESVNSDPELDGIVVQMTLTQPAGAKDLVTSVNIAGTSEDCNSALRALTKK